MLQITLDYGRITAAQAGYRQLGTAAGANAAAQVMGFRIALEHMMKRFNARQDAARSRGDDYLAAGTQREIRDSIGGNGPYHWPSRVASILHGLRLPADPLLPDTACCDGGPALRSLDAESYLAALDDGPAQQREFGSMTSIAVYLAPLHTLKILWIGTEADFSDARDDIRAQTSDWTDWAAICGDYSGWLRASCDRVREARP